MVFNSISKDQAIKTVSLILYKNDPAGLRASDVPENEYFPEAKKLVDILDKKIFMAKVNAIFEAFYTPFDVEKFKNDHIILQTTAEPYDIDAKFMAARNRLAHPEGNYFKKLS